MPHFNNKNKFFADHLSTIRGKVLDNARASRFAGFDPFDGLNSVLFKRTPLYKSSICRLAWLQLHKRLPVNLRPIVGVPKKRNPKGVALFILGLLEDFERTQDQRYLNEAEALGEWLLTQRCDRDTWSYSCWGYHFDWEARAFFVPVGKPNIITTCYVARALIELEDATGFLKYGEVAEDAAFFISKRLFTKEDGRCFYAYIPGERAFVHNASLWGAALVSKMAAQTDNQVLLNQALEVARQSIDEQRENGAWVYGSMPHHQFIDGFHTGYNLEALLLIQEVMGTNEFETAISKGFHYYKSTFFLETGAPKYYNNKVYPLDMHSVAQAIFTLLKVGHSSDDLKLVENVMQWAVNHMYIPTEGRFRYQKHRWFNNNVNYARWTQAWSYYAIAFYLNVLSKREFSQK
ncbi:hypothetical protein [Hahella ganghwensis]|uniref:hypothetical protein n=1 Tax=Hahella ganghwensis TaxID=286420 RepID=UPI00037A42D3|nr:hypothetical protein [Hahella ganghwensis]